jgi:cyclic pyranopterin phosphate synthase
MTRLPLLDRARYERALRMASAARPAKGPAERAAGAPPLTDRFGRRITYLRLSVTDRCNLRCEYCAPVSSGAFAPKPDILLDDEIVEVLSTLVGLGLEKVRFTGGEPLVRPGFARLVRRVRDEARVPLLCLSTNGIQLEEQAEDLLAAGIERFNVSIDTLDPERFRAVTRGGDLSRVLRGIDRLFALGVPKLKVNAVLMRGVNDDEVEAFARLTLERPISVRFIELMPLAHCGEVHDERYVPSQVVLSALARLGPLEPVERALHDGPAVCYRLPGAPGTIGVISPVSEASFCDRCNRVRLSATGELKLCLFGDEYVDLREILRGERAPGDLEAALARAMDLKPEKMAGFSGFTMMAIGG